MTGSPHAIPAWPIDPLPLGALAFVPYSAAWWRVVTAEALKARAS